MYWPGLKKFEDKDILTKMSRGGSLSRPAPPGGGPYWCHQHGGVAINAGVTRMGGPVDDAGWGGDCRWRQHHGKGGTFYAAGMGRGPCWCRRHESLSILAPLGGGPCLLPLTSAPWGGGAVDTAGWRGIAVNSSAMGRGALSMPLAWGRGPFDAGSMGRGIGAKSNKNEVTFLSILK